MHYMIKRAVRPGTKLTTAQRTSSLFAEEPVVLGKVLRRGSQPMMIVEEIYKANELHLKRLVKAGAITLEPVDVQMVEEEDTPPAPESVPETTPESVKLELSDAVPVTTEATVTVTETTPAPVEQTGKKKDKKHKNKE